MMGLHQMSVMEVGQSVDEQGVDGAQAGLDALDEQLLDQLIGQVDHEGCPRSEK
jgi:hypothetical protein